MSRIALLLALGLLARPAAAQPPARYLAMGSSFAAGPGITRQADNPPTACGRSADNYAHQLARRRNLALTDVSCGGATTAAILAPWRGNPAQIDAVTAETKLVTITIGGNDVGYIAGLSAGACRGLARAKPDPEALAKCPTAPRPTDTDFADLAAAMARIAAEVRARAPAARLVFVDYPPVLPARGVCAVTPMSVEDADASRTTHQRVVAITVRAAHDSHVDLITASTLASGHDACGAQPWMNGYPPAPGGAAFHPNLAAMTAIAEALDRGLPR